MTVMPGNCRIVLVRTKFPGNLGAAARVAMNFGLRELVLVSPEADPSDPQARQLATRGWEILERARRVDSLDEAIADCIWVAATSARTTGVVRVPIVGPPDRVLADLVAAAASGPTALVFGPETNGLTNEEVSRCQALVNVPTDPACPALNLAQAVAICLYEYVRQATVARGDVRGILPRALAAHALRERMFANLRSALEAVHFLYDERADVQFQALRRLVERARPDEMEVKLLLGVAKQIQWFAAHRGSSAPNPPGDASLS